MLPVADFNFVVCGIATIAATVGYACVRNSRPLPRGAAQHSPEDNSSSEESSSNMVSEKQVDALNSTREKSPFHLESQTIITDKGSSLKRKRTHDQDDSEIDPDMGYPHNLKSIYPNKRRSGSVTPEQGLNESAKEMTLDVCDSPTSDEPHAIADPTPPEPVPPPPTAPAVLSEIIPTQPEVVEDISVPEEPKKEPIFPEIPRFVFHQPPPRITQFPSSRSRATSGFANFAGSSSPFHSFSPSKNSAPNAGKPIWASTTDVSTVETTASSLDNANEPEGKSESVPALIPAKVPTLAIQSHLTGEEEEDVTLDLKGVKLFVKRGDDNFSGGMVGHIKLLSHKKTLSKRLRAFRPPAMYAPASRINRKVAVFRREPLWKVSMNVRMQPTVRCTFDSAENVIRVVLKELEETADASAPQTVIYAFKPGRSCQRSDFRDFAESLLAQAREAGQS
ncbi:hypothetical protein C8R44DRAFT_44260 [Mycena epipterygia]|nr:hypothetical protein C8R44DRAFT_44260 [Mycena epipterygia]